MMSTEFITTQTFINSFLLLSSPQWLFPCFLQPLFSGILQYCRPKGVSGGENPLVLSLVIQYNAYLSMDLLVKLMLEELQIIKLPFGTMTMSSL